MTKRKEEAQGSWLEVGQIFSEIQDYCMKHDLTQRDFCRNAGLGPSWLCDFVHDRRQHIRRATLEKVRHGLSLSSPVRAVKEWSTSQIARLEYEWLSVADTHEIRAYSRDDGVTMKEYCRLREVPYWVMINMNHRAKLGQGSWVKTEWVKRMHRCGFMGCAADR